MKYLIDTAELAWREAPAPNTRFAKVLYDGLKNPEGAQVSLGLFVFPSGKAGSVHVHEKEVEIFFTTAGRGKVIIDGRDYPVKPGVLVYVPQGVEHQPVNDDDQDWEFLGIFAPGLDMKFVEDWEKGNPGK